ncbi:F-box associated domain containing protein [Tanacetum coccineum]
MASSWVPTKIIVEILLKLPAESLLRCKSVFKLWHSLISEQRFIKSHLTLAPCNTHWRLISFDNHTKSFRLYDHVMFGKSVNVVELENPFTLKGATTRIIGSCNGLLCIVIGAGFFRFLDLPGAAFAACWELKVFILSTVKSRVSTAQDYNCQY